MQVKLPVTADVTKNTITINLDMVIKFIWLTIASLEKNYFTIIFFDHSGRFKLQKYTVMHCHGDDKFTGILIIKFHVRLHGNP